MRMACVDQNRANTDEDRTAWELVSGGQEVLRIGSVEVPSGAYLAAFGFKGPDQQKPACLCSGGERNRLNLALTFKQGGNVLLLDEPTNDEFPGCAVVSAHDRWFLDRVATHILAWEGTGTEPAQWYWFDGNSAGYEQNKIGGLGPQAARPHRVGHRRLSRD